MRSSADLGTCFRGAAAMLGDINVVSGRSSAKVRGCVDEIGRAAPERLRKPDPVLSPRAAGALGVGHGLRDGNRGGRYQGIRVDANSKSMIYVTNEESRASSSLRQPARATPSSTSRPSISPHQAGRRRHSLVEVDGAVPVGNVITRAGVRR